MTIEPARTASPPTSRPAAPATRRATCFVFRVALRRRPDAQASFSASSMLSSIHRNASSARGRPIVGMDRRPGQDDETILLMANEAMSNALRHARARNVWVELDLEAEVVRLEVGDDGAGFDPSSSSRGMGLANLRTRAAELGGTVDVESNVGGGTKVRVEVPRRPR